ncbi:MAG: sigma-70 family RNA polymerase sigma factor [Acidobacteria bacterium]|nr:sigma-70 family RNA polymerase sigma factor [Acidobacteriota bacterium]MBI3424070.1 sigma-70 family RNA polymerase sigma factor [Acidobacteriota bacterium]
MASSTTDDITRWLHDWQNGDQTALAQLMPAVYQELRKIAHGHFRGERAAHTLQTTALIHEAYLRLAGHEFPAWENRAHFYGIAAQLMRQILVEYARSQKAAKRGGGAAKLPLDEALTVVPTEMSNLVALDDALRALEAFDARKCRVIELRHFGGLSNEEIATVLSISLATVGREIRLAQAWLQRELTKK